VTREEILALPAGPELDALVAERVMGWTFFRSKHDYWIVNHGSEAESCEEGYSHRRPKYDSETGKKLRESLWWEDCTHVPPYSTDIASAWEVVEKLEAAGSRVGITLCGDGRRYLLLGEDGPCISLFGGPCCPLDHKAPLSELICRAALLATLEPDA
jgi:hypothetical protein